MDKNDGRGSAFGSAVSPGAVEGAGSDHTIVQSLRGLLATAWDELTDVSLESEDGTRYPAVRALLALRSAELRRMLFPKVDSAATASIQVSIPGRLLRAFVEFCYTDSSPLITEAYRERSVEVLGELVNDLRELAKVGETYSVPDLSPRALAAASRAQARLHVEVTRAKLTALQVKMPDRIVTVPWMMLSRRLGDLLALRFGPAEISGDKQFILTVMRHNAFALSSVKTDLLSDPDIVLTAIKEEPSALQTVPHQMKADRDFMLSAVRVSPKTLEYAAIAVRGDREIVLAAVAGRGLTLEFATENLRDDGGVVRTAVLENPSAIRFASEELREDRDFMLSLVQLRVGVYEFASMKFRADRGILRAALRQSVRILAHAPTRLRADRNIILEASKIDAYTALCYAPKEFLNDPDILLAAIQHDAASSGCSTGMPRAI